jgi:hypothetical protein
MPALALAFVSAAAVAAWVAGPAEPPGRAFPPEAMHAGPTARVAVSSHESFLRAFAPFAVKYGFKAGEREARLLGSALWRGSGGKLDRASSLAAMAVLESSMRVRKHDPSALQRTDFLGAHYLTLWSSLKSCGLVRGRYAKDKPEWLAWKRRFVEDPCLGTFFAALQFSRLCSAAGEVDKAVVTWKIGPTKDPMREIHGLEYLFRVRELREGLAAQAGKNREEAEKR